MITLEQLNQAIIFATEQHSRQFRKGTGIPYITHPLTVMISCFDIEDEDKYLHPIIGVLHDFPEDIHPENPERGIEILRDIFGNEVASYVAELTLDKKKYKTIGKTAYLILELNSMSEKALNVKLKDRIHNCSDLNSMNEKDPSFKPYYIKQTREILDGINRELTPTHLRLIKELNELLDSYDVEDGKLDFLSTFG